MSQTVMWAEDGKAFRGWCYDDGTSRVDAVTGEKTQHFIYLPKGLSEDEIAQRVTDHAPWDQARLLIAATSERMQEVCGQGLPDENGHVFIFESDAQSQVDGGTRPQMREGMGDQD